MIKKSTWLKLSAMLLGGATLFQNGCLGVEDFWDGLWRTGWPADSRWLNIAIDIVKEDIFL